MSRSIFTIVLILLMFGGVTAGTIKVPTDYATIQAGIDAAVNGDTVLVVAGTYYENINFKGKAITVASHFLVDGDTIHINNTIIDGSQPSDPNKGSVVSFTSGEDTTSVICGFTITGGTGTISEDNSRVGGGIFCYSSGPRVVHNKITNNTITYSGNARGGGIGTFPYGNDIYAIIENNIIELNSCFGNTRGQGGGIYMPHGMIKYNIIRGNSCQGSIRALGGGIHGACTPGVQRILHITNNTIENNQCTNPAPTDPSGTGSRGGGVDTWVVVVYLIDNTIKYNRVSSAVTHLGGGVDLWLSSAPSIIRGNTIAFNSVDAHGGGAGIELAYTQDVQIIGNIIEGNKGSLTGAGGGIDETNCSGNLITGNFIKNNTGGWGGGIWATNSTIINNIIAENKARRGGGIFCFYHPAYISNLTQLINNTITKNVADTAGSIAMYKANTVVMNTICWGNTAPHGPEIEMWGGTLNAVYSDIQYGANNIAIDSAATVNWLAGNIDANPLFDFSSYQLSNSSPCIGAGTEMIQIEGNDYECPNSDLEGNLRPNLPGTMPDIGAYENPLGAPAGPILVPEQYATIQAGINAAKDGDMVLVADGTYYENINFKGKAITVASHYLMDEDTTHINNTIIDGSQPSNPDSGSVVFFVSGEDTTSVLCGFTITNGSGTEISYLWDGIQYSKKAGGGILCLHVGARIVSNKIIKNTVYSSEKEVCGGGVTAYLFGSKAFVIIEDNQISHNKVTADQETAYCGGLLLIRCNTILRNNHIEYNSVVHNATTRQAFAGGLYCYSDSSDRREYIVESNTISHNSVTTQSDQQNSTALAGGVLLKGIQGRFSKNEVSHNEIWVKTVCNAVGLGMEILDVADTFVLEGNIIRNNAIMHGNGWGGGLGFYDCSPRMINNIISGNKARRGGGLFITLNCKLKLVNNTIVDNHASETGGGLYVRNFAAPVLMNNIIWNNQAPSDAAIYVNYDESATVQAAYCDIQGGWSGTGNINADPLFIDASFQLSDKSPCINAGIASFDFGDGMMCYCPETDIAGNSRPNPSGGNPDMGAYETLVTKVMNSYQTEIPQSYFLAQNYPNPFNPATTIEFALPKSAFVTLKVFNLLGEEVATLVAEQRSAGIHKLNWDARGLASGVYLYRLEAGSFIQTKKLILMR
jgi:hypothetical protein